MSKKFNLFGIVAVLAIVFMISGCGEEQSEPVGPINITTNSINCVTPPEGVVTSLKVSKTAEGHWNRYLDWTLTKAADPTYVEELCVGDEQVINYTVTVTQDGYTDKYLVSGEITIINDQGEEGEDKTAYISYVDDAIEARIEKEWVEVNRERIREEFTIETGGTMVIPYEVEFELPEDYKSLRNVAYVYLVNHAPGPDTPKEFLFRIDFSIPETPTIMNECVEVVDSYAGSLGEVCGEGASETFTYSRTVSYEEPGTYYVPNTVTAYSNGTAVATATATVTIVVVDCGGGCQEETAWGGNTGVNVGDPGAWWYYFVVADGSPQTIWAGQTINVGTVTYENGQLIINLTGGWELQDVSESVKIQGYTADDLPTVRPAAGNFEYKGTELIVTVDPYPYYAIHLDVQNCQ
jgi:hypothetical protein